MKCLFMSLANILTFFCLFRATKTFLRVYLFFLRFFHLICLPSRCFAFDLLFFVYPLLCFRFSTRLLRRERLVFVLFFASTLSQFFWIWCLFESDFHLFKSCHYIVLFLYTMSVIRLKCTSWLLIRRWSIIKLWAHDFWLC